MKFSVLSRKIKQSSFPSAASVGAIVFSTMMLSACGGSDSDESGHDHSNTHIETEGRLAIYDNDNKVLKVLSLDDENTLESFTLEGESAPRLYQLPGERYSVIIQRNDNLVSFLDSGLYTEDHGDHLHDYAKTPEILNFKLSGVKPTHYETGDDIAIIHNDGSDAASASVSVFSDESIINGETVLELNRENNMHGTAKMIGEHLFVTYRDASVQDSTLPNQVERYSIVNGQAEFEERYDAQCPKLHGAGYNHEVIIFGCSDGILVIDLQASNFPATKFASPAGIPEDKRIGSVYTHHDVEATVTRAGTQLFATTIENGEVTYQELTLPEGVSALRHDFTPNGEFFWVIGDDETLYLWEIANGWSTNTSFRISDADFTTIDVSPSTASEALFVLDRNNRKVIEVHYEEAEVHRSLSLDFNPSAISWMGLTSHSHGEHGHNHGE